MSWTLKLSDEQETVLQAKAAAEGLSLEDFPSKNGYGSSLNLILSCPSKVRASAKQPRHIWDIITENMRGVPREDFAALPKDGLSQIDHYVYSTPKRTPWMLFSLTRFTGLP